MEKVLPFITMTPEQRNKRKEEWKKRQQVFGEGKDPDKEKANERSFKALKLLKDHLDGTIKLSEIEKVALAGIVVERSMDDFHFFSKHVLSMDLLTDVTHKRWCDDHQKSIKLSKKRVMRLKSRGTYKTTVYGLATILWLWGCFSPQLRIFYTSANALLLQEISDKLNQYIGSEKSETLFSAIFGITKDGTAKNTSDVINIKGRSGKGFSLILRTAGGSSVGIHPNVIIVDDPCFVAETPVLTDKGYVNISDIKVGDLVITRRGLKRVTWSGKTGINKEVFDFDVNGKRLTCTKNHGIITENRGKVKISLLEKSDLIYKFEEDLWKLEKLDQQKLLSSMGSNTGDTPNQVKGHTGNIFGRAGTLILKSGVYIGRFGFSIKEKLKKVFIFTTKMVITAITESKIWKWFMAKPTTQPTQKRYCLVPKQKSETQNTSLKSTKKQQNGISLKRGLKKVKKFIKIPRWLKKSVNFATRNLKLKFYLKQNKNIVQNLADSTHIKIRDVYNITVEDVHEFVANGILVANCDHNDRDSQTTRDGKEMWFDSLTPLLVPFKDEKNGIEFESIYYIGTRWHMKDLVNHILERNETLPEKQRWDVEIEAVCDDAGKSNYPDFISDEKIAEIRANISDVFFSCNTGEAPVLMDDFTTKEIRDIKKGDKIIGFTLGDTVQNKSRLVVTEVLDTKSRMADVVKITLESGRVIRCTPDHKWYNGRSNKDSHSVYTPAKVGKNLLRVADCHYKPTFEELLDWRWLGGMIDGEGSIKHGQCSLHQSYDHHPGVCDKIEEVLKNLGLAYKIYERKEKPNQFQYQINGGRDTRIKLIRYGNCGKKKDLVDSILHDRNRTVYAGKKRDPKIVSGGGRDKVLSIEPDGKEMVYSMQTTTGNYVVWGYASKNCQYLNNPLPEGMQIFDLKKLTFVREDQLNLSLGQIACFFDPSLGKSHSDFPIVWWVHYHEDMITCYDCIDKKVELSLIVHQIAAKNQLYGCRTIVFESNGVTLIEQSLRDAHDRINWKMFYDPIHHSSNKHERIVSIQPDLYSGRVRFMSDYTMRYPEAMNQIAFYPVYGYDDAPDCLEMAVSHFRRKHFKFVRFEGCL